MIYHFISFLENFAFHSLFISVDQLGNEDFILKIFEFLRFSKTFSSVPI